MTKLDLWAFTDKEISDLQPVFEKIFNMKFSRDYEDVWEWIWNGQISENQINISREHNFNTGDYSKPLRIRLHWKTKKLNMDKVVKDIQTVLKTKIYIGQIVNSGRKKSDYLIIKTKEYEL